LDKEREATFVIAVSRRGTALCLHRIGGCWRAQGLVFGNFELWYDQEVPDHLYHSYCHDCWPRAGPVIASVIERKSSSSSDSSA
jgi:hypothetical protein